MNLAERQFFTVFYVLILTDAAAGFFSFLKLWKLRNRFAIAKYMGYVFLTFVFWQFCQLLGAIYSPLHGVVITLGYAFWVIGGRVPWTVATWLFTIHLYSRGD